MPDTRLEWVDSGSGVPKLVEKQSQQNTGTPPPVDVIIQQRDKQMLQRLQGEFNKAASAMKQQIEDDKRSIHSKYMFAEANLKRQWDAEKDPGRKQTLLNQKKTLESQALSRLADIDNKYVPANREMKGAYDAEIQKMQWTNAQRDFRLQTIRQLTQTGVITDPYLAKQAEYKALGIDIPITALRPEKQGPDPKETKAALIRDIGSIDKMLERYTPGKVTNWNDWSLDRKAKYTDPETGEERKLNPKNPEDKAIIDDMTNLIKQQGKLREALHANMLAEDPRYGQIFRDQENRRNGADIFLDRDAKGGGIGESITNAISKQNKGRVRVQSPGGQTGTVTENELASYIAQGFKRI